MIAPALVLLASILLTVAARASLSAARVRAAIEPSVSGREAGSSRTPRFAVVALAGFLLLGPAGAILGPLLVVLWDRVSDIRRARATRGRADEQLADAVGCICSAVRSGMSVPQALVYAAAEAEAPLADALEALVADLDVGVPLPGAVDAWAERMGTDDARLLASVLELHRTTGGDLAVVLDQVGATIRERVAAAGEVRALTAQARLSGLILGLLPVAFFGFLWLTSRRDMQAALGTPAGAASVVIGLLMEGAAFLWIRRLLEVG